MIEDPQRLHALLKLPLEERLRLARWLIDSAIGQMPSTPSGDAAADEQAAAANGLLALAGRYAGGPGDTAERAEEILEAEADSTRGLSVR